MATKSKILRVHEIIREEMPVRVMLAKTHPLEAIQLECIECQMGSRERVEKCDHSTCFLFPFRLGGPC